MAPLIQSGCGRGAELDGNSTAGQDRRIGKIAQPDCRTVGLGNTELYFLAGGSIPGLIKEQVVVVRWTGFLILVGPGRDESDCRGWPQDPSGPGPCR